MRSVSLLMAVSALSVQFVQIFALLRSNNDVTFSNTGNQLIIGSELIKSSSKHLRGDVTLSDDTPPPPPLFPPVSMPIVKLAESIVLTYAGASSYSQASAQRYINFAGAAYCADPLFRLTGNLKLNNWSCSACKANSGVKATIFQSGLVNDVNGIVAYDASQNELIIAFAGTNPADIQNWIADLNLSQRSYPGCTNCKVHAGFYNDYISVQSKVKSLVSSYKSQYKPSKISVTGHSLGAALAVFCAADLVASGYTVSNVYNYGQPRVGDSNFVAWYQSKVAGTFRVVHRQDPVPHLPPQGLFGYIHFPYEVYYANDFTASKVCNSSGEDSSCSNGNSILGVSTNTNVLDHLNYMGFDFTKNFANCAL